MKINPMLGQVENGHLRVSQDHHFRTRQAKFLYQKKNSSFQTDGSGKENGNLHPK